MKKHATISLAVYLCLIGIGFLLVLQKLNLDAAGNWNVGWIIIYSTVAHIVLSLKVVGPTELGMRLLLGKPVEQVESGLTIVPWPIYTLRTDTKNIIQLELPGEPEEVQKVDEDNIQPGKKAPIRIVHASAESAVATPEEKQRLANDPLHQRLVTEVSFIVRYRIKDYLAFIKTIGTIASANRQIEDTVIYTAQNELGKLTPAQALGNLANINRSIRDVVQYLIGETNVDPLTGIIKVKPSWGLDLEDVAIKLIDTGKTVNQSVANARAASYVQQATIATAKGEREKLILEGEGAANAVKAKLLAEAQGEKALLLAKAEGRKALIAITQTPEGKLVATLETMEKTSENAKFILTQPNDLFGMVAGAKKVVEEVTKSG